MPWELLVRVLDAASMRAIRLLAALFCAISPGCSDSSSGPLPQLPASLRADPAVTGLSSPVYMTTPAGDSRLFFVEQGGRIRIAKNGTLVTTPFLDIHTKISTGGERGLLGLAFHPQYASNGFFFVYFTNTNGDIQVERYHVSSNPDVADAASSSIVITIPHPVESNHNGGMITFGTDGMLYFGTGDGGGAGDQPRNAQNKQALLGKILRVDIDHGAPYQVPANNPFVGQSSARGEIWAYGLRNPWRFAFDRTAGNLYIADVGQNLWEEVDVVRSDRAGVNYGWNVLEANHCYPSDPCSSSGFQGPVLEYSHASGACSITGGFVYRGTAIPGAVGSYFYSDYCSGFLKSFRWVNGRVADARDWSVGPLGNVTSFGEDATGELYILSTNGTAYRINPGQ
jgi:glucose/arabinose dehydrogenase